MKQAIVVRTDLGMGKGKIAAQSCHACLEAFRKTKAADAEEWLASGGQKVVLKASSENELTLLFEKAKRAKLPCALIRDAGHTQIPAGTVTALAVGPAEDAEVDAITGKLKLL